MGKIYYFDTSAYWKYYRGPNENGFHIVNNLVANQKEPIWISLFTQLEFYGRVAKAIRKGDVKRRKSPRLLKKIRAEIGKSGKFMVVPLPSGVYREAERIILIHNNYDFGTMDAIHIAIVNLLQQTNPNIVMVASDNGLLNCCRALNISTFNPEKDSLI
ncbi:type II toxin-antitoxin system VapC family toxin [Anaerolineales bacterium HSG25]|nr:type II toxin-antitoxin system VapC family toxin [Anaerolineales bacterium HSG25]